MDGKGKMKGWKGNKTIGRRRKTATEGKKADGGCSLMHYIFFSLVSMRCRVRKEEMQGA